MKKEEERIEKHRKEKIEEILKKLGKRLKKPLLKGGIGFKVRGKTKVSARGGIKGFGFGR